LVQKFLADARGEKPHKVPRICHGGTLDPFASGLLLILVEPATKLFDYLHAIPKTYEATIRWGTETDNGDPTGTVVNSADASHLTEGKLDDAVASFVGWHDQIPPATSNKRVDGERAYARAHRGETFELPAVKVYLHEAKWVQHDLPRTSTLRLTVRGGYYVRSMVRDMGRALWCFAHLDALHRTSIGPWDDPGVGQTLAVRGRDILPWAPSRLLTDAEVGTLRQGQPIALGTLMPPSWPVPSTFPDPTPPMRGFHLERFLYLLKPDGNGLSMLTYLPGL
jgi:tRNA pseudouridine55 synthase